MTMVVVMLHEILLGVLLSRSDEVLDRDLTLSLEITFTKKHIKGIYVLN